MSELSLLLCGDYQDYDDELSKILEQLATTINNLAPKCCEFITTENSDISIFGAYCGRSILETACTILIGRITPYRLLLLKRYQEHESYSLGIPHKASIQWQGDVISKAAPSEPLWKRIDDNSLTTPLLSKYMAEIFWIPAFEQFLDDFEDEESIYLNSLRQRPLEPEKIIDYFRSEAKTLYSSLSKGIHQEFVTSIDTVYDVQTLKNLLRETLDLVTKMALISHYIPTVNTKIDKVQILANLHIFEENLGLSNE